MTEERRTSDALDGMVDKFRVRCVEERRRVRAGKPQTMERQAWFGTDPKTGERKKGQLERDWEEFADGYEDLDPSPFMDYDGGIDRHPPYPGAWSPDVERPRFVICFRDAEGKPQWNGIGEETYEEAYCAVRSEMSAGATQIKRIECRGHDWPDPSGYGPNVAAERKLALGFYACGHADELPNEEEIVEIRKIELGFRGKFPDVIEKMIRVHELMKDEALGFETYSKENYKEVMELLLEVAEDEAIPEYHAARKWAREKLDTYA